MAFTPTSLLTGTSNTIVRDWQHAARLFTDDQFRLAPKHDFLFHVAFGINTAALTDASLIQRHRNEIGMLVKSVTLPEFTVTVEKLNQYNRKKNTQTIHKHSDVEIKFHDDNMGLINKLWQNYYEWYYADSNTAKITGAYARNATKEYKYVNHAYGFDPANTNVFFTYIDIYQMARHEYVKYRLINPIVSGWNHNGLSYSEAKTHDNVMKISYEAVSYSNGHVTTGMGGFGVEHYDQTPSPLRSNDTTTTSSPTFSNPTPATILPGVAPTSLTPSFYAPTSISPIAIKAPNTISGLPGIIIPNTTHVNTNTTVAQLVLTNIK